MRRPNSDRDTKLNITMDDEDPNSFLVQAMSLLYKKCGNVTGDFNHLLKSGFVLSRGYRKELAYAKNHLANRRNIERRALRRLLYRNQEVHRRGDR